MPPLQSRTTPPGPSADPLALVRQLPCDHSQQLGEERKACTFDKSAAKENMKEKSDKVARIILVITSIIFTGIGFWKLWQYDETLFVAVFFLTWGYNIAQDIRQERLTKAKKSV